MNRTYSELAELDTFEDRYNYLRLRGEVGEPTFGSERWINQEFYRSREWKQIRHFVIVRDNGCDLGIDDREIFDSVHIHHINPMTPEDIIHGEEWIIDPEYLISTSHRTHNAIHYGDASLLAQPYVERQPGDTLLWGRRGE